MQTKGMRAAIHDALEAGKEAIILEEIKKEKKEQIDEQIYKS